MNPQRRDLMMAAGLATAMGAASLAGWAWTPRRLLADTPGRRPLATLVPAAFGNWREAGDVRLVAPTPDVQQALDRVYDDTLARAYRAADGRLVMLSLSYGRRQRGDGILHRPEVCYAGQGFTVERWRGDDGVMQAGGRRIDVTRLVALGPRPEPVTYWLVVATQAVRFGLAWHWATLMQGLRGNVPDGMLVRVSSVDPEPERAFAFQQRFVQELAAALAADAADRLLGTMP